MSAQGRHATSGAGGCQLFGLWGFGLWAGGELAGRSLGRAKARPYIYVAPHLLASSGFADPLRERLLFFGDVCGGSGGLPVDAQCAAVGALIEGDGEGFDWRG